MAGRLRLLHMTANRVDVALDGFGSFTLPEIIESAIDHHRFFVQPGMFFSDCVSHLTTVVEREQQPERQRERYVDGQQQLSADRPTSPQGARRFLRFGNGQVF
ncbi:MAG: hypothetical protein C0483_10310 [Pirellula sp.]|nr:hypothetical protein [Pirellula sp.]